jgi:antibiotic biosynthesis monooxygenase (ABM) superfamily enzyme
MSTFPLEPTPGNDAAVTKIIDRIPKAGHETALEQAIRDLVEAALRFPGHLGVNVIRPVPPHQPGFRIVYKFDTLDHLRAWETSETQRALVEAADRHTSGEPVRSVLTGLETWFTLPGESRPPPPRYKMSVVSWLGIFPLVLLLGAVLNALLPTAPGWLKVALNTGLVVPLMTYAVMPRLTRLFKFWLYPEET